MLHFVPTKLTGGGVRGVGSEVRGGDVHGGAARGPGHGRAQPGAAGLPRVLAALPRPARRAAAHAHAAGTAAACGSHLILYLWHEALQWKN